MFTKIVGSWEQLTIFVESSIWDVRLGSDYVFAITYEFNVEN